LDLKQVVKLPPEEDLNDWIAVHGVLSAYWLGLVVTALVMSSYSTSTPVSNERVICRYVFLVCICSLRPTQSPSLSRMGTEYQPRDSGNALRLGR